MAQASLSEHLLNTESCEKWKIIGTHKRAGLLVPLFSVYSKNSIGIGDFDDLKLLIDFAYQTNNSILQLLPLNELGSLFCPYDSVSSFALEPLFISLNKLLLANKNHIKAKIKEIKGRFAVREPYVDYGVKREKMQLLWEAFLKEGNLNSGEFKQFREENNYWIDNFALFKVIKGYQGGRPWYKWEDKYKNRDINQLGVFLKGHEKEILFQMWVQWQLYKQFKDVKKYAESKKVLLKGDLPVLVSRDSADVWAHPEFFKSEFAAGAPPDMYAALGQRWGMPTYNWEKIAVDNYRYLKEKLRYAENFYDILRIDHVVGLFRIWSIPYNEPQENQGLHGFFDPRDEHKWEAQGKAILSVMLNSTRMLLCAEDLGVIPKMCTKTIEELGIPGNDVQRWVKDYKIKHDFLEPKEYRLLSVAMLSTHDTTNWPAWYEFEAGTVDEEIFRRRCSDHRKIGFENVKDKLFDWRCSKYGRLRWRDTIDSVEKLMQGLNPRRKGTLPKEHLADFIDMYENTYQEKEKLWRHLKLSGPMREKCAAEIVRAALKVTLDSNAIFSINTIIDWLYLTDIFKGDPYQYRINTPGTISDKNWSLRIPISLEDLLKLKINKDIRRMITASGRI